ncbi:MAG: hypothetical protein JWM59_2247 [Verrucomicrobiales bacterium]|nr:hypothetical protein [Verrucomicrobiales bacterium]
MHSLLFKILRRTVLALLGLFLVLEAVLWLFVRTPVEPLKRLDLSNSIPGLKKEVRVTFDRHVARYLDDKNGSKPPGTVRILCLGGSGTLSMLQNAEDTWWGQLGRMLQKQGLKVEVAAWGQEKAGIVASTPVAGQLMEEWRPDLVIGNFGFDDVVSQPVKYTYRPDKARRLPPAAQSSGWKQAVLTVSQTARLGRLWSRNNEAAVLQNQLGRPDRYREVFENVKKSIAKSPFVNPPARPYDNDPLKEYLDGWKILESLAKRHGATLVMTGEAALDSASLTEQQAENLLAWSTVEGGVPSKQTVPFRPSPVWVEQEMERYAAAARDLASELKVTWFNLNGTVPRDPDHFFSDVQLTDKGAAAAAGELLPVIEPFLRARGGP